MTIASPEAASLQHADRFFIGGEWVKPSSESTIKVVDSTNEEVFLEVAEAQADDISRAVGAARNAFDSGPWAALSHGERAEYMRAIANGLRERAGDLAQVWPREAGALFSIATGSAEGAAQTWEYYAGLADTYPFEERATPTMGNFGLLVREPVGVVGAIIPSNGPLGPPPPTGGQLRPRRAGAGRRRRRHLPVERPARPDQLQAGPGPAGRLHRDPEELAGSPGRGPGAVRDRRIHRPAGRRHQRRHGRP